ncbi:Broad-complex core protein isoforms 1/2/3/4/5 [Lucilia cuprina]|uniref:Broad-complex core protein isoforms 1/2/3/4/5 n=1 Tax=Lucilia cuprina TaxID=7375 RepID=A0A0L0C888_LUCCU|nr:Broad-complex core protein isoforms 1/2/3/4/5 [Lucilia cuprina]
MTAPQQYSLRWNNYFRHLTYALDNHRVNDDFVDVSLLCDGRKIKAHKVVLSACSSYFKEIFTENPHPHPVIIFKFIKYEDLNSIIEFMYQGEVNVQQEALQSFLQTAELLAVQGLTAEEKEKPKPPAPLIEEQKLMKSIPSTIRAVNDATTATQTIDIPLLHTTTQQIQIPQLQTQTQTTTVPQQQQQQHHHVQTQIQHIQVHQNTSPATTHQVTTVTGHQQQLQVQHQVQQQQHQHHQQSSQTQQVQVTTQPTQLSANIVTLPATTGNSMKKRKITFSDDDDNIYTTETVDEQTIVKTADMTLLRGTIKMDIPEYIVSEVDDRLSDAGGTPGNNQDSANSGQNVTQYPSEYEILTESEIDDKFHQGDNSEMTLEMGRLLNPTTTSTSTSQNALDDTTSSSNVLSTIKTENKVSSTDLPNNKWTECQFCKMVITTVNLWRHIRTQHTPQPPRKFLLCKICKRKLNSPNALRRHIASKHSKIMGKEFDCSVCHKGFKTKWSLSTHNSRFHRDMKPTKECIKMEFME